MDENLAIYVNRKKKAFTKAELEKLSRDDLISRIIQLETHNQQLKNIIKKETSVQKGPDFENQRRFDFSDCYTRHVLLKLYYLGWDYQGFTTQENSGNTIEHYLFYALQKTCLIHSRETSNYHRCGRTDKGVSAFSQVISIDLRSKYPPERQMTEEGINDEIRYCESLNRVLPKDIRVVAWQPLHNREYSARFDCRERIYRYFFPRSNLDIDTMQAACQYLIGTHDFRNLCKMDVGNGVITFEREIKNAQIVLANENGGPESIMKPAYDMFYLELTGTAFLWHQVRCIMAILFMIGEGTEKPEIIRELLDVEANPCTPQYSLATDLALNLFDTDFEEYSSSTVSTNEVPPEDKGWIYDYVNLSRVIASLQEYWTKISVKNQMVLEMLYVLEALYGEKFHMAPVYKHVNALQEGVKSKHYQPLMRRTKCNSLENRIAHYAKKRRIEILSKDDVAARKEASTSSEVNATSDANETSLAKHSERNDANEASESNETNVANDTDETMEDADNEVEQ